MKITKEDMKQKGVEEVVVNGMQMYKRHDRLFLTAEHACYGQETQLYKHKQREMDEKCSGVPYKYDDDIFRRISRGEVLVALVKF